MADFGPPGGHYPPPPPTGATLPFAPAERPKRPITVTLAVALMILQVVITVAGVAIFLANSDALRDVLAEQMRQDAAPNQDVNVNAMLDTMFSIAGVGAVVFAVVFAGVYLLLAWLNYRGNNVGRIISWVVCGLGACCCGLGSIQPQDGGPPWYQAVQAGMAVLTLLINVGIIVLLALPVSNAYFRPKPQAQPYG